MIHFPLDHSAVSFSTLSIPEGKSIVLEFGLTNSLQVVFVTEFGASAMHDCLLTA